MQRYSFLFAIYLVAASLLMISCQDSTNSLNEQPPQLPPVESMNMDFSAFDEDTGANLTAENESYTHFLNASIRAMVMKAVVNSNLAIPKALLNAAENVEPELTDDGEWTWSYSNDANGNSFEVELVATSGNNGTVLWQMYVTNSALDIDDVLFFEGDVETDGSAGSWTYYALFGEEAGSAVSQTTWNAVSEDQIDLRLEVLTDRNNNLGDYIEYSFNSPVKIATYYNAGEDQTTKIEWNSESYEGYFIAPNYNNGEQACWDSNFQNVECG